jgi:hypothetical protein
MTNVTPWDNQRGKSQTGFLTDKLYFADFVNSEVWAHNPIQNLWNFSDTTHMRFAERRGFNLSVLNGAGSAYMDVLKFVNQDTLSIGGSNLPGIKLENDVVFTNSRLFPQSGITQFDIGTTARPSALYVTGRGFYDSRVQILNSYSSTSAASNDNFNSLIFKNTNSTDNNWSALSSYNNTGTIASCIGFQHISQSSAYDEIAFYTRHTTGFQQRFRIGSTITAYHPFVANSTFTAAQTSTFTGDATFNAGAIFNAQPTFNTTVNIGTSSTGSRLNVVNDYSSTSVAASNAYTNIQLSNRNTTNNNWSAIEWGAGGAFGVITSDIANQYTDHSSFYSDLVFHLRTNTGYSEVMRLKGGNPGKRVGINNASPTEALDVTGNFRFSGALMPNNAAGTSGQILQSAGAGSPPTWVNQSSITGVNIYNTDGTLTGNRVVTLGSNTLRFLTSNSSGTYGGLSVQTYNDGSTNNNYFTGRDHLSTDRFYITGEGGDVLVRAINGSMKVRGATTVRLSAGSSGIKSVDWTEDGVFVLPSATPASPSSGSLWYGTGSKLSYREGSATRSVASIEGDITGAALQLVTANNTPGGSDNLTYRFDANAGSFTVTLDNTLVEGRWYTFRCTRNGTNTITFNAGSGYSLAIDGSSVLTPLSFVAGASGTGIEAPYRIYTVRRMDTIIYIK